MYTGDLHQFYDKLVRVICLNGYEYVGVATSFRDHDEFSLPGSDCIQFFESNTGRRADFFRADIKDIQLVCNDTQFVETVDGAA